MGQEGNDWRNTQTRGFGESGEKTVEKSRKDGKGASTPKKRPSLAGHRWEGRRRTDIFRCADAKKAPRLAAGECHVELVGHAAQQREDRRFHPVR
jgi:hypothetical protein